MLPKPTWMLIAVVALITVSSSRARAESCSPVLGGIQGLKTLPAHGSRVPRSTLLWLRSDLSLSDSGEVLRDIGAVRLLDERGKSLSMMTSAVRVTGEQVATLFVLKPMALLDANANYRIELNGTVLSQFSTSEEVDTQPPALPKPRLTDVRAGASSCGGPSQVKVMLEQQGDVNFLVESNLKSTTMPSTALAVTTGSDLTALAIGEGPAFLRVVAFDLSGNLALSTETLSVFVPSESAGCSSTLAAPGLSALALLSIFRRRRPRSIRERVTSP
jgi:hypothetical protein